MLATSYDFWYNTGMAKVETQLQEGGGQIIGERRGKFVQKAAELAEPYFHFTFGLGKTYC